MAKVDKRDVRADIYSLCVNKVAFEGLGFLQEKKIEERAFISGLGNFNVQKIAKKEVHA